MFRFSAMCANIITLKRHQLLLAFVVPIVVAVLCRLNINVNVKE